MKLTQHNNCNKIRASGEVIDALFANDLSNVESITMTGSINNCQIVSHQLTIDNNSIIYPTGVTTTTDCKTISSCDANIIYSNIYDDLKTEINTNTTLTHSIGNTSTTIPFCGITGTSSYGDNIIGIRIIVNNTTLQINNTYNSGQIDYSSVIKNDIEQLLNNNNIVFTAVTVTYQLSTAKGGGSRYVIVINSTTSMTGEILTDNGNWTFSPLSGCKGTIYGFNHKRSTFTLANYNDVNTELVKWYTDKPWDYSTATGVLIESYNNNTFNIMYNVSSTFNIYMEITTNDSTNQTILYNWSFNGGLQQLLNPVPIKNKTHYEITPNGDTSSVLSTTISGVNSLVATGTECVNYLEIEPSFFGIENSGLFSDGIYTLNVHVVYNDGVTVDLNCSDSIFVDCILKCVVADCVYQTKSYELMTYYKALKALSDEECKEYVAEMTGLFKLLTSSLCYDSQTITNILNEDCGCS